MTSLIAGIVYSAVVFAAGFVFGTIRTIVLAPAIGPLAAVIVELPFMLAIAWFACRRIVRRFAVPADSAPRWTMGTAAFALLMIAEYLLAIALAGTSLPAYLAQYTTAPGLFGLAGQVMFATFPAVQTRCSA